MNYFILLNIILGFLEMFFGFALVIIPPGVISVFNYNLCVYVSGRLPFCKWVYALIVN